MVSYFVTLAFDQTSSALRPGMTASAQVVASEVDGALSVPSSAISRRGGTTTVTVVRGGRHVQQPVVAGIAGDSTTQILSGLNAGDRVAIAIPTASGGASATGLPTGRGAGGFGGGGGWVAAASAAEAEAASAAAARRRWRRMRRHVRWNAEHTSAQSGLRGS